MTFRFWKFVTGYLGVTGYYFRNCHGLHKIFTGYLFENCHGLLFKKFYPGEVGSIWAFSVYFKICLSLNYGVKVWMNFWNSRLVLKFSVFFSEKKYVFPWKFNLSFRENLIQQVKKPSTNREISFSRVKINFRQWKIIGKITPEKNNVHPGKLYWNYNRLPSRPSTNPGPPLAFFENILDKGLISANFLPKTPPRTI